MKLLTRFFASWLLLFSGFAHAGELRIAAAASLAESITEIAESYQKTHGTKVTPVFAGSNVLARQIESGAPIDLFVSADERTMDGLVKKNLIHKDSVASLLSNALVVVLRTDSTLTVNSAEDLAKLSRIAIADPAAVPAGVYAKTWLTNRGIWEKIQPKTVGAENVRAALAAVEAGNADASIVYRTDAAISTKVKIAYTVPDADTPPIVYPLGICRDTRDMEEAKRFIAFLREKAALDIFRKRGFTILAPAAAAP